MNYIYDIVLNFQNNYYQFFEWNRNDKIKNISKIAVYHIEDDDLINFIYNKIIIDSDFLEILKEANKKYKKIMCLVSNTKKTIGLLFSTNGTLLKRSSLLFEEENEVNNFARNLPLTKIAYQKNELVIPTNGLRIEIEKKDALIKYVTETPDLLTLKYLYYEYFKKECSYEKKIKTILLNILDEEWNLNKNNLYKTLNILTKKDLLTK